MLTIQQIINAAITVDGRLQMKSIPGLGLNLGPLALKAEYSTTELLRNVMSVSIIQLFLKQIE